MESEFGEGQFEMGLAAEMVGSPPGSGFIYPAFRPTPNKEADLFIDLATQVKLLTSAESGDVCLAPLFIQTKRSEKLTRSWTDQWKKLDNEIGLDDCYFRFNAYLGENEQHNQLVMIGRDWPLTYYAAPAFVE